MTIWRVTLLAGFAPLAVAGCGTATIEDAVPAAALETPAQQPAFSEPGEYPNLNVNPQPAAPQFTDEEFKAQTEALRARREQLAGETSAQRATDSSTELRALARSHADRTLQEIEGE